MSTKKKEILEHVRRTKGNLTRIGEVQERVGGAMNPIQRVGNIIVGIIFIIVGIFCIFYSHESGLDSNGEKYYIIFGIIAIILGFAIIWVANWWYRQVKERKTYRQINAALFEMNALERILRI